MNNHTITLVQPLPATCPSIPEPPGPVPAPDPRRAEVIPGPPLNSAVTGNTSHASDCCAIPRLVFVRAEQDGRGRWTRYHHAANGSRVPITEDGFLIQSGCSCLPGDAFLTIAQVQGLLSAAKQLAGRRGSKKEVR